MAAAQDTYLPGVALIIGAGSGIGKGTANTFAAEGCRKIFLSDINAEQLAATKRELEAKYPGVVIDTATTDISSEEQVNAMVASCVQRFGRVDYACNVAGIITPRRPIVEDGERDYDKVISVNEYGTWLCHRAEIRQMLTQDPLLGFNNVRGSIVSVSSVGGMLPTRGINIYASTKHAIIGFSKTDAQDFGPRGVRVNVVCPGTINTELFRQSYPKDAVAALAGVTPLRRLGEVDDVGLAIVFLSSSRATFITGAVLPVDGGLTLERVQV